MAALLGKIKSAVSGHSDADSERGRASHTPAHHSHLNPAHADEPRAESRGRGLTATGRGGAGNMSRSRVRDGSQPAESAADVAAARSRSRSRARAHHHGEDLPVAAGRGGLGNVRSQSKGPAGSKERERAIEEEDKAVEARFAEKHKDDKWIGGRGGAGNVTHGEEPRV
ncbi:uncharacterized protein JCM10292_005165 [Rhodotorula paludigena]|uniref:uncharacterized protein n=1 Tax=Rhodotorula paludigena TaxID=86838 RepID=UPI00317B6901